MPFGVFGVFGRVGVPFRAAHFVTAWPGGFESKKQAGFVPMSRLLEFDALLMGGRKGGVRTRKAAKYGRNPTLF